MEGTAAQVAGEPAHRGCAAAAVSGAAPAAPPPTLLRAAACAAAARCRQLLSWLRSAAPQAVTDTVCLAERRQQMEHFGASDAWVVQSLPAGSALAARCAQLLFDRERGAGLSCWRFNVGGGLTLESNADPLRSCETFELSRGVYDWTRNADAVAFLRAAAAAGVPHALFFANSPPRRLTRNGLTNCDDDAASCNLRPGVEREYANYLADIVAHFSDGGGSAPGVPITAVTPLNEPQWRWLRGDQEGCRAANTDVAAVATALRAALDARGLRHVRIAAPDSGTLPDMWRVNASASAAAGGAAYGAYASALPGDPATAAALGGLLSYHSYWSDEPATQLRQHRAALAAALPHGWRLWQTEYCLMQPPAPPADPRALGMPAALRVACVIHYDLTLAGAAAWHWWLAVSCYAFSDGLLYVPRGAALDPADAAQALPAKRLWALAHFARFVRPGYVRVHLVQHGGDDPDGVMASAYAPPADAADGVVAVAVYMNAAAAAAPPRALQLEPPPPPGKALALRRWLTDETHDCEEGAPLPLGAPFTLPPRSITTLLVAASAV
jgi:O-glycosyl hydrolase